MYGKLENSMIICAPAGMSDEEAAQAGYLPIVDTPIPNTAGGYLKVRWEQREKEIVQIWESEERKILPGSEPPAEDLEKGINECKKEIDALQQGDIATQTSYALEVLVETFTDSQALNCILLFPAWSGSGVAYKKGERLRHEGKLYKVLLDHTSQADWVPGSAPSLYVEVSDPAIEYPEWKQPTGAHDAYQKGDKVTYNGKKYISLIDSNTYSPADYPAGWKLVEE